MTIFIGIVIVIIQSVHKDGKARKTSNSNIDLETNSKKTYSKIKTFFFPLLPFVVLFVFGLVFKPVNLKDIINSNLTHDSVNHELYQPNIENYKYNHSANIVNGGQGCFDGTRYFFSGEDLRSEDISGGVSKTIYDKAVYYLNSVGNYLYFILPDEENDEKSAICRIKKDGTDFKKIYDNTCHELTYYDSWLYFSSNLGGSEYHICRMRLDGTNMTVLADCRVWYMSILNDKIFFSNYDDGRSICSMNVDGSDYKQLRSGECYDLCVVENKIYFSTDMNNRNLHSIDIDGHNEEVLIDSYVQYTNYYNGKLYFINSLNEICCCDSGGNNLRVLYNDLPSCSYITLLPGKLCCCGSSNEDLIIYDLQ